LQLHRQGYCFIPSDDPNWLSFIDAARGQLEPLMDLYGWRTGANARIRFTNAWKEHGSSAVKTLAFHPELNELLHVYYGRQPFMFHTLNFPVDCNQAVHSDVTHFHYEPQGFMCGVPLSMWRRMRPFAVLPM